MAEFATNASGAMWLPKLAEVTESISGSVVPLKSSYQYFPKSPSVSVFLFNYDDFEPGDLLGGGLLLAPALCSPPTIPCPNIWKVSCIDTDSWYLESQF